MSRKLRILTVAAASAGMIGMWAPAALASTGGDGGGLVNVSHNQVPIQACGNFVPVNGVGGQVPLTGIAGSLGLLSAPGVIISHEDKSCHQPAAQDSDPAGGDGGGLVNVSHNQVPIQVCNNTVPVNGVGGQVPVSDIAGALGILSAPGVTAAAQDSSCHQPAAQDNN